MSRLILNADDFGLTAGVNRAVVELHRAGALTSATLMAHASATSEAIAIARSRPSLGVGCHLVLVDGEPMSAPERIHSLLGRPGNPPGPQSSPQSGPQFHPTLGSFVGRLLSGRIRQDEIEAEACAQINFLESCGVKLTHVDTHKHTHMFPAVLRPVLRAARAAGIRAVRNPFEPAWSVRATPGAPLIRRAQIAVLRRFERGFHRIVREEGFVTTAGAIGVLATGTLDSATVDSLLRALPPGTWELVTHPGYNDAALAQVRTRLRDSRQVELAALGRIQPSTALELVSFAALQSG